MANKLILKRSSVAAKVPLSTDLEIGELAVNLTDKKLFTKDSGGTVIELGGGGASLPSQTGNSGKFLTTNGTAASWGDVAFSAVTGKPTTLSGYGITDAAPSSHVGSGGAAHAAVTTSVDGFMSAADKTKLDGIASGATANTGTVTSVSGTGTASGLSLSGTVTTSGSLTLSGTVNALAAGTYGISISGSAATLTTGRTIGMTGDVTWTSASFNGSGNVTGTATLANSGVTAGTYRSVTVDVKGRVTGGTNPTTLSGYGITDAVTAGAGGAIIENSQTIAANYTLTAGKNGMSAGVITINSGVTVTVPSGANWVIV